RDEAAIADFHVTGVQTCALPISPSPAAPRSSPTCAARRSAASTAPSAPWACPATTRSPSRRAPTSSVSAGRSSATCPAKRETVRDRESGVEGHGGGGGVIERWEQ